MEKEITGMMIYYYFVCHRKLWYFCHEINMEQENENVQIGKILDENTYAREEKHLQIDNVINIDYIKEKHILHEIKKSKAIEIAGIWQLKYYLYYLSCRGVEGLSGKIDYPLLKKSVDVSLTSEDINLLTETIQDIYQIVSLPISEDFPNKSICKKCAYFDLCFV
jgi:CRISPR-associated exonuclease Cas4